MFKITWILSPMDSSYSLREARELTKEEAGDQIMVHFIDSYKMDTDLEEYQRSYEYLENADFIGILIHGGLTQFNSFEEIMNQYGGKKKFFIYSGFEDENRAMLKHSKIFPEEYSEIVKYIRGGSTNNCINLYKYLSSKYGDKKHSYDPPEALSWEGIYYPKKDFNTCVTEIAHKRKAGTPIIGVLFYSKYAHERNTEHIDALITEVEKRGAYPFVIYTASAPEPCVGCKGFKWVMDNLLMINGNCQVDAIINVLGYSQSIMASAGDGRKMIQNSIFEALDIPVMQGVVTYQTYEDWKTNLRGVDGMSFTSSIYYPEFDGQITTTTFAYSEYVKDHIGNRTVHKPILSQVSQICRLAINWAKLRIVDNKDKKVAILFHNMPPRNDMIGCAFGLDTPQSVYLMVEALKKAGVKTEYSFEGGDEIIQRIINAVTIDTRWLSADQAIERSVDTIAGEEYRDWFSKLDNKVQEELIRDWGNPPGEYMVHNDTLPLPGIINGNIFIGLQPPRGYEEKAEEVYHNTDIVPPHQYISYYKWIRNAFKADVIFHVGTHGTLEWLPGKEIGLSKACYPYVTIDDIPHLYPYSITVLGEGIQAKRRSHAVILDHLIPSMMLSGTYDDMEELDELLKQHYQAKQGDQGKIQVLKEKIIELALENNYDKDLNIHKKEMEEDFQGFIKILHSWLESIKNTLIKDGLHIFGRMPTEERLENMICALLRLSNGEIPSLLEAVSTLYGYDYKYIVEQEHKVNSTGKTNLMIVDELEEFSRKIIHMYIESKLDINATIQYVKESIGCEETNIQQLLLILDFICQEVMPKLKDTEDEIKNMVKGIEGRFVPPGKGGSPTRGNVDILPTGRNFYSIDPRAVPTRASWEVGKQLGDQLIERYLKEEGMVPQSVVIVIYAGETMKTSGDDVAEVLYLMGIKPKWVDNTDIVMGLEVIPLEELKRPRIDVTLRISGLFRDTFPNLIEMIEEAVNKVAALDESGEDNYLKRNIDLEVQELLKEGASLKVAQEESKLRIFSDPPGTYGAGVDMLIESKNWKDYTDLGNNYVFWGGHAYGKNVHGKRVTEVFSKRMSRAEITIKNESSMEIDMLESDDFYNYHGGLIAAVRTKSGKKPKSYCGDSSDPARVKLNDVGEQSAKIMRARILNPKWFDGLTKHGYKGAQEISGMVNFVFGWDATSDIIEDWMYEKISENYLFNDERREWIKSVNPWAVHNMVERLLEANQRGMWNAKEESLEKLHGLYLSIEGDIEEYI
ncbi:cobaltochelatase subunit CobN [Alkalibaculum bacchi]|uniref:cobaltochelatase subunit CobN n=1 Tax=Alkalibaculum bacchi TaxID=645887 RepID=UPI0026EE4E7D|nr:cobaltochelatase subunit CobN [Alkalibaculum bacchi]